jgi:hypothetical protein
MEEVTVELVQASKVINVVKTCNYPTLDEELSTFRW